MNKPYIDNVIIVEGATDKNKILSLFDARILITNGYDVDANLLRLIVKYNKLLVLTDPDEAGKHIRKIINGEVHCENVEVDIVKCDRDGKHGVAECSNEELIKTLTPYVSNKQQPKRIENVDLYNMGVVTRKQRKAICNKLGIKDCSSKKLLDVLNIINIPLEDLKRYAD